MTELNWHCDECNREFKTQSALTSHAKTHAPKAAPELPENAAPSVDQILWGVHGVNAGAGAGNREQTVINITGAAPTFAPNAGAAPTFAPNITVMTTGTPTSDLTVKVKKLAHYGNLPDLARATIGSAGFDLYAALPDVMTIRIGAWRLVPTGLAIEIPPGWVGFVVPRSGLAAKSGITVLNTPGIIDSDYRGEIQINLVNNTMSKYMIQPGSRIGQILFVRSPIVNLQVVDELSQTMRGEGGFGSTGV